jgi:hypothetical protein
MAWIIIFTFRIYDTSKDHIHSNNLLCSCRSAMQELTLKLWIQHDMVWLNTELPYLPVFCIRKEKRGEGVTVEGWLNIDGICSLLGDWLSLVCDSWTEVDKERGDRRANRLGRREQFSPAGSERIFMSEDNPRDLRVLKRNSTLAFQSKDSYSKFKSYESQNVPHKLKYCPKIK